ncbi:MAG: hypothetical protein GY768_21760 [Planctomycetaceae bacterium]|nr:hypothetical protein [Planctomycetaceae bacterium]
MNDLQRIRRCSLLTVVACALGCSNQLDLPQARQPNGETVLKIQDGFEVGEVAKSTDTTNVSSPTGFATLRGTFKLEGNPPTLPVMNVDKDTNICAPGGETVYDQDFVFDPSTQGIANIVVYAEKVPEEWIHESAKAGKTNEVKFDQKQCIFLTRMVAIQTTQKLRALNSDPVGHNLKVASFNQTIPSGGYAVYQPLKQERSPVEMNCSIHPWMRAWMITRDNSYFAVTKADGSFEIPNLPAGVKLQFKVWQERSKFVTEATVNDEKSKWSKGRMSITLQPGQDKNLDVVLDSSLF